MTLRERTRLARHAAVLETALRIVSTEGRRALTMQRVANELECAVGTIYRYFPSKDVLLSEILRESLETLHGSLVLSQSQLDELLADRRVESASGALTRAAAVFRFWILADDTFPQEMELSRALFSDPDVVLPTEDAGRVVPTAFRLLDFGRCRLDEAVEEGVLRAGDNVARVVTAVAGLTGVVLTSKFSRFDASMFDGHRLALLHLRDLLTGWGAEAEQLARVEEILAEHRPMAPVPVDAPVIEAPAVDD